MCGVVGAVSKQPVNQLLYDGLLLLQHRGQDAAGIATSSGHAFHMHKANGMVRDVFRTRNMRALPGSVGIGHVRYPTAGSPSNSEEAQPFYVNAPYGITLAHNGNLTNTQALAYELFRHDRRHINTQSDSEVLLNVFANSLHEVSVGIGGGETLDPGMIFDAVQTLFARVRGAFACVLQIAGYGLLAFRDPHGIRPLCYGVQETDHGPEYLVASESVALEGLGYQLVRDIRPGEAIFIDLDGRLYERQCSTTAILSPCIFEYVYFARPDSLMDGVSIYDARLRMGEYLADKVRQTMPLGDIDVVMPIPDTSRPAAMELATRLNLNYREGFIKNRYVGRTFIMPGQQTRKKSVRQKLNAMGVEFAGKNVLLVDDSIVRGTTSQEIVQMARDAGANRVYFASASPPVRYPNVYGIDMPTHTELIAHGRDDEAIGREIGADRLVYQDLSAMLQAVRDFNPAMQRFESSCFDGDYVTGDVTVAELVAQEAQHQERPKSGVAADEAPRNSLNLFREYVE